MKMNITVKSGKINTTYCQQLSIDMAEDTDTAVELMTSVNHNNSVCTTLTYNSEVFKAKAKPKQRYFYD